MSEEREQRFVKIEVPVHEISLVCWKCLKPIMRILATYGVSAVHGDVTCNEADGTHTFSDKQSRTLSDELEHNTGTMLVHDKVIRRKRSNWETPFPAAMVGKLGRDPEKT